MGISLRSGTLRLTAAGAAMAAAAALAGCAGAASAPGARTSAGPGTGSGSSAGAAGSGRTQQQALRVYQQFAQCARAHGAPDFPDPSLQHGTDFGVLFGVGGAAPHGQTIKAEVTRVLGRCGMILHELPASVLTPPPTAADLRQMTQYAQCVRQHGVVDFPDPRPDGTFPVSGTSLAQQGATPQMKAAFGACGQHHWSFDGGSVDRS